MNRWGNAAKAAWPIAVAMAVCGSVDGAYAQSQPYASGPPSIGAAPVPPLTLKRRIGDCQTKFTQADYGGFAQPPVLVNALRC